MTERFLRRRIEDQEIWVDLEGGEFYGLNATAERILALWREGVRDSAAIAARLAEEFDVAPSEALPAVAGLLEQARAAGLLEP